MDTINLATGWSFWRNAEGTGEPQLVSVPHDAMLSEPRSADAPTGSAGSYFPGGIYRYERELLVTSAMADCVLTLEFEGVYRNARVLLVSQRSQLRDPDGQLRKNGRKLLKNAKMKLC